MDLQGNRRVALSSLRRLFAGSKLRVDRNNRHPFRGVIAPVLPQHPLRPRTHFRGELVRRLACHSSILSGAVHREDILGSFALGRNFGPQGIRCVEMVTSSPLGVQTLVEG